MKKLACNFGTITKNFKGQALNLENEALKLNLTFLVFSISVKFGPVSLVKKSNMLKIIHRVLAAGDQLL